MILFRDHLSPKGWLGVAATLVASAVLAWGPGAAGIASSVLVLLACLCWGLDNHLTALIDGITPSQSTLWKGAVAGTVNLTIGAILAPVSVGFQPLVFALLVGALSYGASIVLYIRSAQAIGITLLMIESHSHVHSHEAMFHEHSHRHDDGHHTHVHSGLPKSVRHSHPHYHEPMYHRHPHWPDLHHRHLHESRDE